MKNRTMNGFDWKKSILLFLVYIVSGVGSFGIGAKAFGAALVVNIEDKKDSYDLKVGSKVVGKVHVKTKFVEEPVLEPLRFEVSLQCGAGYQQKKLSTSQSWKAFDYGTTKERKLLSTFNKESQELVVYFWEAKMDEDGAQAVHDRQGTKVFSLKEACVHVHHH